MPTVAIAAPAARQGLAEDIAAAEQAVKALEQDKEVAAAVVIGQQLQLLRLYREAAAAKKVAAVAKKLLDGFAKRGLVKDGGRVAAMAAEAQFWLLDQRAGEVLQRKGPKLAKGKAQAQLSAQFKTWTAEIAGTPVAAAADALAGRQGGLCGALHGEVGAYFSREWQVASAWLQARLLGHLSALATAVSAPAGSPPEEQAAVRQLASQQAAAWQEEATVLLQSAWAAIDRHSLDTPYKAEVLRDLNRYQPRQFPLSRVRGERWLDKASEGAATMLREAGVLDDLRACYDRHLVRVPDDLIGEISVTLQLQDGKLSVQQAEHADPETVTCVQQRLAAPRSGLTGGPLVVRLRLEFASL
jgi:hypothetical protein